MLLDHILTTLVLLCLFYLVFFLGKIANDLLHKEYKLTEEMVVKDNPALSLAVAGYYLGLVLGIGGTLTGAEQPLIEDVFDLCVYGPLCIILLNLSWFFCDRALLYKFRKNDELIRDRNQGTGAVSFGVSVASGMIIYGSMSGEGGHIWTAMAFWALGQIMLMLASLMYNFITPYDVHTEIEKDNVAAGVSFAGALIAMGIVVGISAQRNFEAWEDDLPEYLAIATVGLVLLPAIRFFTDKILLPTVKLTDEIANQEKPNVGAAYVEAVSYIGAALIICWCI